MSKEHGEQVLRSWKEIAHYLGCGVRTVQRWELELGLPVRRPRSDLRSPVIALKTDLDAWVMQTPVRCANDNNQSLLQSTLPVVAVVDDNAIQRYALATSLARAGFSVLEAACGEAGIRLLKAVRPDVAVLDLRMPDVDGFEVCRRIKLDLAHNATAIIVYTAAQDSPEMRARAQHAGANVFHAEYCGDIDALIASVRRFALAHLEPGHINAEAP